MQEAHVVPAAYVPHLRQLVNRLYLVLSARNGEFQEGLHNTDVSLLRFRGQKRDFP